MNDINNLQQILQAAAVGLGMFVFAIVSMMVLFGLAAREALKNKKGLGGMLVLALMLPIGVVAVRQYASRNSTFAKAETQLKFLEIVPGDDRNMLIGFETETAVICYLEVENRDGNRIPVLPSYQLDMRDNHYFLVDEVLYNQGPIYAVMNNQRILIKK